MTKARKFALIIVLFHLTQAFALGNTVENTPDTNSFADLGTIISGVAAIFALLLSWIIYRGQSNLAKSIHSQQTALTNSINAQQATLTKSISDQQITLTNDIHRSQQLLSQRQILIPLWEYISGLADINPSSPVTPDVIKAVNTLELIALSCEGNIIDKSIILRTFSEQYIKHYENIRDSGILPGLQKSGKDILKENRAAMAFYKELINAHMNHGRITQI